MDDVFAGAVAYADNVCLLSPSLQGLREMLSVVECFALMYCVEFNPEKSVLLVFSHQNCISYKVDFLGEQVTANNDTYTKHLGLYIGQLNKRISKVLLLIYMHVLIASLPNSSMLHGERDSYCSFLSVFIYMAVNPGI